MTHENDCKVTSEILDCFQRDGTLKPMLDDKNVISRITFKVPELPEGGASVKPEKDEDGDYIVQRKKHVLLIEKVITLEHSVRTEIKFVGLQIWRAALLLADFIIHNRTEFTGKKILELGSGVGLTSIVAGMFSKHVICTDVDLGNVLNLIRSNIERNMNLISAEVNVEELDFFNGNTLENLKTKLEDVDIILAADVIYDNDITEAFVQTITKLLSISPNRTLYLALEKRFVFTLADLDSVAPCYEHLKICLEEAIKKPPFSEWTLTSIPLDFPQFFNYERTKHLIIIKISS